MRRATAPRGLTKRRMAPLTALDGSVLGPSWCLWSSPTANLAKQGRKECHFVPLLQGARRSSRAAPDWRASRMKQAYYAVGVEDFLPASTRVLRSSLIFLDGADAEAGRLRAADRD